MSRCGGIKRAVLTVMLALAVRYGAALGGENGQILLDGVAARVNGDIVTVGDVFVVLAPKQQKLMHEYAGAELKTKLVEAYKEALDSVIERRLIIQSYNSRDMKLPEWVVDERIDDIIRDSFDGNRAELTTALARDRMTFDEWRNEWRERIIENSMRGAFIGQNINITPGAIRERYERDKSKYSEPEKVNLKMIVLKHKDGDDRRQLAGEIAGRLAAGEEFAALAGKYSDDDRADDGGDWEWIEPKMLRKELAVAVSAMEPGTDGKVVEVENETYVIQVCGHKEQAVRSLEDAHAEIEEELRMEEAGKLYRAWVMRLREEAHIEVSDIDLF